MTFTLKDYVKIFPDRAEEVEEKAGILEYDAGLTRWEAEDQAVKISIKNHLKLGDNGNGTT